jgi:hypothetical protein
MSDVHKDRIAQHQHQLAALFEQGTVLVSSADAVDQPGIRQTVSISRNPNGTALVDVEYYYPCEWDHTIDESQYTLPDLDQALVWLEVEYGIHWSQLHEPGRLSPHSD